MQIAAEYRLYVPAQAQNLKPQFIICVEPCWMVRVFCYL